MKTHSVAPDEKYLTTREVARYLRLNEKKVYALVASSQLPAARISGKWLFSRELIDQWVAQNTVYPTAGLMGALLDQLVVLQGSDDWLLGHLLEYVQETLGQPIPATTVGSLAGLDAVRRGRAHLAACHVESAVIEHTLKGSGPWYRLELFERTQGLVFDREKCPQLARGLGAARGLRMARRQPLSGTHRLATRLLAEAGIAGHEVVEGARCGTHLKVALAIRQGHADFGLGIEIAAEQCSLSFLPLRQETFQLVVRADYLSHPSVQRLLGILLERLRETAEHEPLRGYSFEHSGRLEPVSSKSEADPGPDQ